MTTWWLHFGFSGGTMGVVDGTCPAHYGYDARVEILCEKGLLLIGSTQQQTATKVTLEGEIIGQAVKTWRNPCSRMPIWRRWSILDGVCAR